MESTKGIIKAYITINTVILKASTKSENVVESLWDPFLENFSK